MWAIVGGAAGGGTGLGGGVSDGGGFVGWDNGRLHDSRMAGSSNKMSMRMTAWGLIFIFPPVFLFGKIAECIIQYLEVKSKLVSYLGTSSY